MACINSVITDSYALYNGDCCQVLPEIESDSVHYSVFSPPFASLYSYSDALEDLGNCSNYDEFFEHFGFVIGELFRVIKPGRLCSVHCMQIPLIKERDGVIGLRDFRGDIVRAFSSSGWIFHSETIIPKDPLIEATRTKALGLQHKQIVKDSSMCRMGIPDYVVTMRKPGSNCEPVSHLPRGFECFIGDENNEPDAEKTSTAGTNKYSHHVWRAYASPVWSDIRQTRVLDYAEAREENDERHICPLQLDVIERCLELWSNPGDVVLSPFAGIGSEGFCSIKASRRFVGIELKASYYRQACKMLDIAVQEANAGTLFDIA